MTTTTVAVIGAGISGLAAIKCCLDGGLQPTCFEWRDNLGGLLNYTTKITESQGSVMHCTNLNTSKEFSSFSDFPMPVTFPLFPRHSQMLEYLKLYADHFGLIKCIQFNKKTISILPIDGDKWKVVTMDTISKKENQEIFDVVMICTGHHTEKFIPEMPGMETYKGQVAHSHEYRHYNQYEGKNVVVVGMGNSGADVSTDVALSAKQVYASVDKGIWTLPRMFSNVPYDLKFTRRTTLWRAQTSPASVFRWLRRELNERLDHQLFGLEPNREPITRAETVSDELMNRLISGRIIMKPAIKRLGEAEVTFVDDTTVEDIDVVLFATGFLLKFPPFASPFVRGLSGNKMQFYKYVVPANCQKPNLFYIGFIDANGPLPPLLELQARMAVAMIKHEIPLPSSQEMWRDIEMNRKMRESILKEERGDYIMVNYLSYFQELCCTIGCNPNLLKLIFTDPALAIKVIFGPMISTQSRLHGPGAWSGARKSIMQVWDRTFQSLRTRRPQGKENSSHGNWLKLVLFGGFCTFVYISEIKYGCVTKMLGQMKQFELKQKS